jgi:outer membrane protein TolC
MRKIVYTVFILFFVSGLKSQEFLTLDKVRRMAIEKSEDLKIAETTLQKSEDEKAAVKTNYFPKVSGSLVGFYSNENIEYDLYLPTATPDPVSGELVPNVMTYPGGATIIGADGHPIFNMYAFLPLEISLQGAYMAGLSVQQPIYTGGKIAAGHKMAKIGSEMAIENLKLNKMKVIVEADKTFWLYVSVKAKEKLAEQSVQMLSNLVGRVENTYKTGLTDKNELLKVQVQYNKALLDQQKVQSGLELTRMSLCRVTGLNFNTQIVTDTTIVVTSYVIEGSGNEDVTQRYEYKLMLKGIDMEKKNISLVRSDFLPTVGINVGYNYIGGIEFNNSNINRDNLNIMASFQVPIFHWGEGRYKVNSAKKTLEIKQLELEKNTQLLCLEIENAKLALHDAYYRIEIAELALGQAIENLRVCNDNYELGNELLSDLLIAQTQWQLASNELLEAKIDFRLQETEYLRVTSQLIPEVFPDSNEGINEEYIEKD